MNAVGFTVFAGVRKKKDGDALKKIAPHPEKLIPVILDVTKDDQVTSREMKFKRALRLQF